MQSRFKVGEEVVIVRVLDNDDKPDVVAEWHERIGQTATIITVKDHLHPLRYSIKVGNKHIGDWLEDELEEHKNRIVTQILKDL